MTDAQRVDVERLRAVMALLNQGAMLNEAGEPCAAGHFFGKYQTEAADFLRDNAEGIAALLLQVADLQEQADRFHARAESYRKDAEAAERAREAACGLLREALPVLLVAEISGIHPARQAHENIGSHIAAFLAANGGK